MPKYDAAWRAEHAGPLPARVLSRALARIARHMGRAPESLAVTQVSRRRNPFQVLVATLISLRTKDEVTGAAAARLFSAASTPRALSMLPPGRIARLIYPAGFYRTKARTLRRLSRLLIDKDGGRVPDTLEALLALPGVGRKTANLVLTLGYGKPGICVDTHVHRVMNRLGFVRTETPDDTEQVLRGRLPRRWWIPVNDLLVSFGRTTCVPISPRCSTCPVRSLCLRAGVARSR